MKQKLSLVVRGNHKLWNITCEGDAEYLAALRADGLEVFEIQNTWPQWVVGLGLLVPWRLAQDAWKALRLW